MNSTNELINRLLSYGIQKNLIHPRDLNYHANILLRMLDEPSPLGNIVPSVTAEPIEDILEDLLVWAEKHGKLPPDPTIEEKDLFDTEVMAALTPPPSYVEERFLDFYQQSPCKATDFLYRFAAATNYIREKRIAKDEKWSVLSPYGDILISINLSKPEKDPRDIERAKHQPSRDYPKCLLCAENENYKGGGGHPARGNHRLIELKLAEETWFLQYSPYVYYNEHCIILKETHEPMKLTKKTFRRMMDFVRQFPHYFIGSNADLPIVGGSILSHDHFQGGRFVFPMEKAKETDSVNLRHHEVSACILRWPVSVIRLRGKDPEELAFLGYTLLERWKNYSDPCADLLSHTGDTPHNTITPIARLKDGIYELDLALRNNRTTPERPHGLFHPRESLHHIKKENIGLIEVMGLAILPARLKSEMQELSEKILRRDLSSVSSSPSLAKHYSFAEKILKQENFDETNIRSVLEENIGKIFTRVLEDAGVFKQDEKGLSAFQKAKEVLLEDL